MVFHKSLSDSTFQVSKTLLSILVNLTNAIVWMVSTRPLISKCSSPGTNPLVTVPSAPIKTGITLLSCSIVFFNSQATSRYLSLFSFSFSFTLWSAGTAKATIRQVLCFLFFSFIIITRSCRSAKIRWPVCISKYQRTLCVLFSRTGLCIYHLFIWSNLNFLHNSKRIMLPTQSCLVLYSFCTNLLHSLIIWLIVSSLSSLWVFCISISWWSFTKV